MSKFYGTLLGCRGEATRCGTVNSGIRASVQSYDGSIISNLYYDNNEQLRCKIGYSKYSTSYNYDESLDCSFEEFKELVSLYKKLKRDEAEIIYKNK